MCGRAHGQGIPPLDVPVTPRVKLQQQSSGSEDTAREDKRRVLVRSGGINKRATGISLEE